MSKRNAEAESNNNEDAPAKKSQQPVSVDNLKLGTKLTAKVQQIRARGLVLDLGNGIRGMYRFEVQLIFDFYVKNHTLFLRFNEYCKW